MVSNSIRSHKCSKNGLRAWEYTCINWFVIAGSKVHLTQDTGGEFISWIDNNNKIALVNELVEMVRVLICTLKF